MSHNWTLKQSGLAMSVLSLMLIGLASSSSGNGCSPSSPSPCAADGICRPKRDSWGHYTTRWRPWPGETVGQQPTEASPEEAPLIDELPKRLLPKPEEEDLRGPAKDKKKDRSKAKANEELPAVEAEPFPEPDDSSIFDPQGQVVPKEIQIIAPQAEDAPPALPASLRQAAMSMAGPRLSAVQRSVPTPLPAVQARPSRDATAQSIQQVNWQRPAIGLVNPASTDVVNPESESLQQAIYYEASDLEAEPLAK